MFVRNLEGNFNLELSIVTKFKIILKWSFFKYPFINLQNILFVREFTLIKRCKNSSH
jgi:hypothetical protein